MAKKETVQVQENEVIDVKTVDEGTEQHIDIRDATYSMFQKDVINLLQAIAYNLEQLNKRDPKQ